MVPPVCQPELYGSLSSEAESAALLGYPPSLEMAS
jgi:hypothetical protein